MIHVVKRVSLTCCVGVALVAMQGCSADEPLSSGYAEDVHQEREEMGPPGDRGDHRNVENVIGGIELANGGQVSISEVDGGPVAVSVIVTESNAGTLLEQLKRVRDVAHLYEVLAPEVTPPHAVKAAAERLAGLQSSDWAPEGNVVVHEVEDLANTVDTLRIEAKEAPRDVQGFRNLCASDLVVESAIGGIYARRSVQCHTERTGNGSLTVTGSRQGISTVRSYRGTIGLRWSWKNGNNWVIGGSSQVAEGQLHTRWVFGAPVNDLKFEVIDASGDGYHWQLETADNDPVNPKSLAGNDWYQQSCVCMRGLERIDLLTEGCTSNQWVFDHNATTLCQLYQQHDPVGQLLFANGWTCGQVLNGHWERATFGKNCNGNLDFRECMYENNCRYVCTDVCRLK